MKTQKLNFTFLSMGFGAYNVTYTSPVTGKKWSARITDMELIDATKNSDTPFLSDLNRLKRVCKQG